MLVSLIDLAAQYQSLKPEIDEAVARVLSKGQYVNGEEVEKFESEWAEYCKAKYAVAVSSGTDALYLAARVYATWQTNTWTTPRTFIGTVEPLIRNQKYHQYNPVLILSDDSPPAKNKESLVYVPVHLYGYPTPIPKKRDYKVIEDSAQAHGQPLRGDAACFSYYPTKNLGAVGQGGSVVSNDKDFIDAVRILRSHGETGGRFRHQYLSGNYRMDELQAAILRAKLPHLDAWNKRRREIAKLYCQHLAGVEGIALPKDHLEHVFHIFAIETPKRDSLAAFLKEHGVQTAVRYPIPLHLQPALAHLGYKKGDFPDAERWADETLSLPIYPEISDDQVEYVIEQIREWALLQ